jgi:hypothetical protein
LKIADALAVPVIFLIEGGDLAPAITEPTVIPPDLAAFAGKSGISYREVALLLDVARLVSAHGRVPRDGSMAWAKLHEVLTAYFGTGA